MQKKYRRVGGGLFICRDQLCVETLRHKNPTFVGQNSKPSSLLTSHGCSKYQSTSVKGYFLTRLGGRQTGSRAVHSLLLSQEDCIILTQELSFLWGLLSLTTPRREATTWRSRHSITDQATPGKSFSDSTMSCLVKCNSEQINNTTIEQCHRKRKGHRAEEARNKVEFLTGSDEA